MRMDTLFNVGIEKKIRDLYHKSAQRKFYGNKEFHKREELLLKGIYDNRENDFGILEDYAVHGDDQAQAPSTADWKRQVIDEPWYK